MRLDRVDGGWTEYAGSVRPTGLLLLALSASPTAAHGDERPHLVGMELIESGQNFDHGIVGRIRLGDSTGPDLVGLLGSPGRRLYDTAGTWLVWELERSESVIEPGWSYDSAYWSRSGGRPVDLLPPPESEVEAVRRKQLDPQLKSAGVEDLKVRERLGDEAIRKEFSGD
jgi:hypothetical protein